MARKTTPNFSLKDQLFNAEKVAYLGGLFRAQDAGFDPAFEARVQARLTDLELKERISWIAECLAPALPGDFAAAASVIEAALPPPLDPAKTDDDFGDFIFAPLGAYVVAHGIAYPERALETLKALTMRFSVEDSIRPFLDRWPELTWARLHAWAGDENYHVRRLVSEGTRPFLPWSPRLTMPVDAALPLLDRLYADPTRYVTRSVANHLNDISKKDLNAVCDRLERWASEGRQEASELAWMTRHALRTAVKAGAPRALRLLGYDPSVPVQAVLALPVQAAIGEAFELQVTLDAEQDLPVLVDYIVHFIKANGAAKPKVFKLKQAQVQAGQALVLAKTHRLKGDATTFALYPGPTRVVVQVNGVARTEGTFALTEAEG